jgi:hypothetical protein
LCYLFGDNWMIYSDFCYSISYASIKVQRALGVEKFM